MPTAKHWITQLNLEPHPEGGFYAETYRADDKINGRNASTAIYYLLEQNHYSAFHRIDADEMWHFYTGTDLTVYWIDESGNLQSIVLGSGEENANATFQALIPKGLWFAAKPSGKGEYSLVGCTVAPGFDFSGFELATAAELIKQYPKHQQIIQQLT